MSNFMGVDIGGTSIKGIIVDEKFKELSSYEVPTCVNEGPEVICAQMKKLIDELLNLAKITSSDLLALGMGIPGVMDKEKKVLKHSGNLHLEGIPFLRQLEEKYNVKIFSENDANVAALGEFTLGAGKGAKNMIYITVSTGIGAGAIFDGELYQGSTGNALEVGHFSIDRKGDLCSCGKKGCLEALCSGTAISKKATSILKKEVTCEDVFALATSGNVMAQKVITDAFDNLGNGIASLANVFDPDVIVLGGGVIGEGTAAVNYLQKIVQKKALPIISEHVEIKNAALKGKAGSLGAAILAMRKVG